MRRFIPAFMLISMVLVFSGCTSRFIDYTLISSKNMDLTRLAEFEKGKSRIQGEDRVHTIIIFPTKAQITVKEAMDNAIESVPGCIALIDGVVYFENWAIPFIYGTSAYIVEGTPLIDPKLASYQHPASNYVISKLDSDGKVSSVQYVSKEEYISERDKIVKAQ